MGLASICVISAWSIFFLRDNVTFGIALALTGISGACVVVPLTSITIHECLRANLYGGAFSGLLVVANTLSGVTGPSLIGVLADAYSWRVLFPFSLASVAIALAFFLSGWKLTSRLQ